MIKKMNVALLILSVGLLMGCQKEVAQPNLTASKAQPKPILNQQTTQCLQADGVSYEQLAVAFSQFQVALQNNDPAKAAVLIHYPLRVNVVGNKSPVSKSIKNAAQFIQEWPGLISPAAKQKIIKTNAQDSNQMICNWQGIGFADGALWFFGDSSAKIYVLNT